MILPNVNVLVHAFRSDYGDHHLCRNWLDGVVNGDSRYGTSPQVLSGVPSSAATVRSHAHAVRPTSLLIWKRAAYRTASLLARRILAALGPRYGGLPTLGGLLLGPAQ
jgi:predicted nucleic acid-binding protein